MFPTPISCQLPTINLIIPFLPWKDWKLAFEWHSAIFPCYYTKFHIIFVNSWSCIIKKLASFSSNFTFKDLCVKKQCSLHQGCSLCSFRVRRSVYIIFSSISTAYLPVYKKTDKNHKLICTYINIYLYWTVCSESLICSNFQIIGKQPQVSFVCKLTKLYLQFT